MQLKRSIPTIILSVLLFFSLLPLLMMFSHTLFTSKGFSLSAYKIIVNNPTLWYSFQNSLMLSLFVSFFTTLVGVFLGLILEKTTLTFRSLWLSLLLFPLLIPPYIVAYAWYTLLGNNPLLFSFWGTAFTLFSIYLPIPILLTILFLKQINPKMEEAALLYCSWGCVVRKITLPLIAPAILFSALLVFMLSFGEFSVANFLRYDIFPKESFTQFSAFYNFKVATVTAMPMLFLALIVIFFEKYVAHKPLQFSASYHTLKIDLKRKEKPLMFFIALFISMIVLLPLLSLVIHIDAKSFLLALNKAFPALNRSIFFALIAATLLVFFGFLSAYIVVQQRMGAYLFSSVILLLFILPSTLIGIALILFYNTSYTNFIYATPLIIIFGYTIKYLFLSSKIIEKKLIQIPHSLIDAAKLSGASSRQIAWFIMLPLVKDALILAWVVGFIFSLRESTITMLVYPAGSDTLPLYIFTQMANGDPKIIASLSLIMILILILPLSIYFLQRQLRR